MVLIRTVLAAALVCADVSAQVNSAQNNGQLPQSTPAPGSGGTLSGYQTPASGAVPLTITQKLMQNLNIQDFGGICDAPESAASGTDNTAAILAAIDYANLTGGATIHFPHQGAGVTTGGCGIKKSLVLKAGGTPITLDFDGPGNEGIVLLNGGTWQLTRLRRTLPHPNVWYVPVSDFLLDAKGDFVRLLVKFAIAKHPLRDGVSHRILRLCIDPSPYVVRMAPFLSSKFYLIF